MQKLREYQTFKSVQEMNENELLALENFNLSEAQRDLYLLLCRHSVKFPGVSFLKVDSMAEVLKTSTRTVRRHLKYLQDMKLIKRIRQLRIVSGGFGASLTIICPIDLSYRTSVEDAYTTYNLKTFDEDETIKSKTISKDLNKRKQNELDHTFVNDKYVSPSFIKIAKNYYNDFSMINSLWSKIKLAAYKSNFENDLETVSNVGISALKMTIAQIKRKKVKDVFAYLYRVAEAKFEACYFEQLDKLSFNPEPVDGHWLFA